MTDAGNKADFTDVRPMRWKSRLLFWIVFSIVLHGVLALVVWRSQTVRDWLFSSFRDKPVQMEDLEQLTRSRILFDKLVRKRMVEANQRILMTSRLVLDKRTKEWNGVAERAAANPHFKKMFDAGLPPLDIINDPGVAKAEDILALYARSRRLEEQVISLYEHFKAVNLSLMSVSGVVEGQPVPQSLDVSLSLGKLERPARKELDRDLLTASDAALFAIKAVAGVVAVGNKPAVAEQPDGFRRWRAEATSALEQCEIIANNCQRILENVTKPNLFADGGFAALAAARGGRRWEEPNGKYVGESLRPQDAADSDLTSIDVNAVMIFGKHLGGSPEGSKPAKYLVIDTWWSIGPFDYVGGVRTQESLEHVYPPENGVDLDAVYVGKGGRALKWEYHPMSIVQQVPRWVQRRSLWYFYTEFWSDKDQLITANVASDDYGVLWLNNETKPVYASGQDPRPWVLLDPNQFCKLKVRRGTNRLLFKLDNNGGTTGFTVLFRLK